MDLVEKYSSLIDKLSKLEGVYGVYLFGSFAKKKQKKRSDIDICFFIDKNNQNLREELMSNATEQLDISIFSDLPLSIQFDILKNGKALYVNNKKQFREIKMRTLRRYKDESWVFKNIYFRRYGVRV